MSNFAGAPSRQLHHPDYVPSKFSHAIKSSHNVDKQFKRFERHLKRNATQLPVQRSFVLLVDVCTQTEAMIDHATQTGLPILIDTETQTGEYSVVDVISRSTPRKQYVMQDKEVIWVTRTTQTKTAYMLHKGVDVPDIESVQPTIFFFSGCKG